MHKLRPDLAQLATVEVENATLEDKEDTPLPQKPQAERNRCYETQDDSARRSGN